MSAVVIDGGYFLRRVGEPDERPRDRHFAYRLLHMEYCRRYREARAAGDYEALERCDREWNMLQCL